MCNLYRMTHPRDEVAKWFAAQPAGETNAPAEIYKGQPGLVVADGVLSSMGWGFPHQPTGKSGQKLAWRAVNNARDDKLKSYMWRFSFEERRCLIPATAYAEAEGPSGRMTRTWISAADQPLFACAAIWDNSDLWGPVYSMVTCAPDDRTLPIHDRTPVILRQKDWQAWTEGTPGEAFELLKPYPGPLAIDRTEELWANR